LPDIDTKTSYIGEKFHLVAMYLFARFGHRGLTHNVFLYLPLMILPFVCCKDDILLNTLLMVTIFPYGFGSFFHIIGDGFTTAGVGRCLFCRYGGFSPLIDNFVLLPERFRFNTRGKVERQIIFPIFTIVSIFYILAIIVFK